ncbi:endothelin-converting enzyme homolog [Eurytemora carolleeae]|uniref:endothelin-converting enzyme homolog n=1 Tax=Eurytemora carolleeae TaxID=1294199 RepID=UPI000C75FC2F|nr:endothelin-converting enzyme homolog [Eurytemora carolleeae]|eukprot:XP_023331753.1 endothelin-converting enzyme homolog [Eurytemora affinis]
MAHYTRQKDTEPDLEDRPLTPTSEILSDGGGAVSFISPSFRYRVKSTNIVSGRTCLEKVLASIIIIITLLSILLISISINMKGEPKINMYLSHLNTSNQEVYCLSAECVKTAASVIRSADFTVDPCQDFYQYACGGWERENPIPDGKPSWSTFGKLWQENQQVMKIILEDTDSKFKNCSSCRKAQDYYQSCIDKNGTLEKLGGQPLLEILNKFYWNITDFDGSGQLEDFSIQTVLQQVQHGYNVGGFFVWNVGEDDKNSSVHILQIDQGGLTLGNRDMQQQAKYHKKCYNDKILILKDVMIKTVSLLYRDKKNISSINEIVQTDIQRQMEDIIQFEKKIAEITAPASEQRDEERRYHSLTVAELQNISDFFHWEEFFQDALSIVDLKINSTQQIIVYSPEYLNQLSTLLKNESESMDGKNTLNNYLMWQLIRNYKGALSKEFREVDMILKKAMMGTTVNEERWRQCVSDTDNVLGFALGALFVNKTFDGNSKPEAEEMIKAVTDAFIIGLRSKNWIDKKTKVEAERKAKQITNMIGYPDYINNKTALDEKYIKLDVNQDYFGNNVRFNKWNLEENLSEECYQIGTQVPNLNISVGSHKLGNQNLWQNLNFFQTFKCICVQIVFPAGILQLPFFSLHNPKSLNFGAMGVVMGHELSHAFDDQGREYDGDGNMRGWWENKTLLQYKMRVGCMEDQYCIYKMRICCMEDQFIVLFRPYYRENVNGKQTVGENIADNGGLKASYEAYQSWLKKNPGAESGLLPGVNLTHNQLFFLSFSQVWCSLSTPESEHYSLIEDAHSPPRLRVLGTLSNSDYFSETYKCKEGSKMNPERAKKCTVW